MDIRRNAGLKLAAFALLLATALGVGAAVGTAVGPIDTGERRSSPTTTIDVHDPHGDH